MILTFCRYKNDLAVHVQMNNQAALVYLVKMGGKSGDKGNMGILFSQSDHTYCRIPARDFKYQGRQGFQKNEQIIKRMDIKQASIQETDTGFRTSGCGYVCIQVVPPDPEVHKLATRSTCMDGGCILTKLATPKA